jgi:serine/threonine protein kinase
VWVCLQAEAGASRQRGTFAWMAPEAITEVRPRTNKQRDHHHHHCCWWGGVRSGRVLSSGSGLGVGSATFRRLSSMCDVVCWPLTAAGSVAVLLTVSPVVACGRLWSPLVGPFGRAPWSPQRRCSFASDVYALAMVLYELAKRRLPFEGVNAARLCLPSWMCSREGGERFLLARAL